MKRKCHFCEATTNQSLGDFHEIDWNAFSISGEKATCYCPKHKVEGKNLLCERINNRKVPEMKEK